MHLIGSGPVNDRAGRADLNAASALDAGTFAKRNINIRNDHALGTALRNRQCKVTGHLGTGTDTASAQDAAVVIENKIRMGGIHCKIVPARLNRPVRHLFVIGGILQLTVAAADLAERAKVITLAE